MGNRFLIIGATGLLGPYLMQAAAEAGQAIGSGGRGGDIPCDLTDMTAVKALCEQAQPDVVIHAAGLTDVDRCEREPELANEINRDTIVNVAKVLADDTLLVYVSTDQVYPDVPGPHEETATAPVNAYGRSKLEGETAALTHPRTLVLRTNLFGPSLTSGRSSLSDYVIDSLRARREIVLFDDVLFSPLHLRTLAQFVLRCVESGLQGVYNIGSRAGMSKAAFALAIADHLGLETGTARVGTSTEVPQRSPRPRDLRLNVARIEGALGCEMPRLEDEIALL